jgi:uncharacterized damage-inducible protein DinB
MSLTIGFEPLLAYSDHERQKWRDWIAADPTRLGIVVQAGGRFPTIGDLIDHVFLVERRHLCRLHGAALPEQTGVPAGDWSRLFEYGELVRADLRRYAADIDNVGADGIMSFEAAGIGTFTLSRRRLMTHMVLHEIRHLAQLALAARTAGVEPPGHHDLIWFEAFS